MSEAMIMLMLILPVDEARILARVSAKYKLTMEQTALLGAIRRAENGGAGKEMGVEVPRAQRYSYSPSRSLYVQAEWCAGTIKKHYTGYTWDFAIRYCPNNYIIWDNNVRYFMKEQGVSFK